MKSYRIDQPKPKPKHRSMQDLATPGTVLAHNGQSVDLAIPCYYMEIHPPVPARPHDRIRHDMLGWPWPNKPDQCCQEWDFDRHCCRRTPHMKCCPPRCEHFLDMRKLIPIHLIDEGYESVDVFVLDGEKNRPEGITAVGEIDEEYDNIIRIKFDIMIDSLFVPSDGKAVYHYSVYVSDAKGTNDLAAIGNLIVYPSPMVME